MNYVKTLSLVGALALVGCAPSTEGPATPVTKDTAPKGAANDAAANADAATPAAIGTAVVSVEGMT